MFFSKKDGKYICQANGVKIYSTKKLGLVISPSASGFFLQKHGTPADVLEWKNTTVSHLSKKNPLAVQDYIYLEIEESSPAELNKMFSTTNYFPQEVVNKAKSLMN